MRRQNKSEWKKKRPEKEGRIILEWNETKKMEGIKEPGKGK